MQLAQYRLYLRRVMIASIAIIALSAILYGVFLFLAVQHTASRASAEKQIGDMQGQLGTLEMQYLSATKDITPEQASQLGYTTPTNVSTVFASGNPQSLSLQTVH